jgi:3-oxoadipate enol-lactonase
MKVGGPIRRTVAAAASAGARRWSPTPRSAEVPPGRMLTLPGRGSTFVSTAGDLQGDQPPLLMLHALACTAGLTWFTAYSALAERHPLVMFDQRWHGRGIRAGRRFRIEDLADDAVAVADELGIDQFIPVGYSLGGAVAQMIWKRHPERVSGLVLAATARNYRGSGLESTFFRLLPPLLVPLAITSPPTLHASALEAGLLRDLEGGLVEGPEFSRWALNELKMTSRKTTFSALSALGSFNSAEWIGDVDVPTSVVVTLRDKAIRTSRQQALARAIPHAAVFELDGGHVSLITKADEFSRVMVEACNAVRVGLPAQALPVVTA